MSVYCKNKARRLNRSKFSKADLCEVTLNDFANSTFGSSSGRLKKNSNAQVNQVVKEVKQLNLVQDDHTWEEKLNLLKINVEKENEVAVKKINSRRRKKNITSEPLCDGTGIDYPIDIWFLISEYIHPEDVGRFALICKTSLAVVSSAAFWFNLYKRYYKNVPSLPEHLQPECMVRKYGLRTNVIRALYFMYPPFISKIKPQVSFDGDPHLLTKRVCVLAWSRKIKNHWLFCFKLKRSEGLKCERENKKKKLKHDLLEILDDITVNEDDNCKLLQVTCLHYVILPMLSGQILSSVSLNVSQGMRYHRLQLNFGSGPFPNINSNAVILDPVINIRVLDWWNPSFPYSGGFNSVLKTNWSEEFDELEF